MKLRGKTISGPNIEYIVIPRHDGDLVFKAQAVLDMAEFEELVKLPKPGKKMLPGGKVVEDRDDAAFRSGVKDYADKRYAFIILKSLSATDGLEWDTVKLSDPDTWLGWDKEMEKAGCTFNEINLIQVGIAAANGLSQDKLDEARARFLASLALAEPSEQLSLTGGL
jgi:hypothetical protein